MVHLVISRPRLREALHHYVRFRPVFIDTLKVRLDRRDSTAVLAFDFGYDANRQVASNVSMATPHVLRAAIGPSLCLHHVRFRHDEERGERRMQKSPERPRNFILENGHWKDGGPSAPRAPLRSCVTSFSPAATLDMLCAAWTRG